MNIEGLERWHFELTEKACNALLDLVLQGKKRATAGSVPGYLLAGEQIPREGAMSVITDWAGKPRCVVRTTRVRIIPYKDITFDIAKLEGEDDNLASWQQNHEKFFTAEGEALGYSFTEDLEVVFEEFELLEVIE